MKIGLNKAKNNKGQGLKILAIIPARGGSKRIPRKNIAPIAGKPLIYYTINAALKSEMVNRVVVSTDDGEIAAISKQHGAEVLNRPDELAQDHIKSETVLKHVVNILEERECYVPDIIVFLQPTTVLRNARHIDESLKKMIKLDGDSVLGVCKSHKYYWYGSVDKDGFWNPNYDVNKRYEVTKQTPKYRDNGAIYAFKRYILMEHNNRLGGKIVPYEMSEFDVFEIDTYDDLRFVKHILLSRQKKEDKNN